MDDNGLAAEFVAPRLWEDVRTIDGGYTSNDSDFRKYAIDRSKRSIDIANALGIDLMLWLAREGTYIRESKDSKVATERIVYAINQMLEYDSKSGFVLSQSQRNQWTMHIFRLQGMQ